ncbi:MAG: GNAT family N-acetyltransferase, partial [Candidatus Margulisiibacteriota bacterium]
FISDDLSDYLDVIVEASSAENVFSLLIKIVFLGFGKYDWIEFKGLSEESANFPFWKEALGDRLNPFVKAICVDLPSQGKNWDEFCSTLPKKRRNDLKRTLNLLQEEGAIRSATFTDYESIKNNLHCLVKLHKKRWGQKQGRSQFDDPETSEYYLSQAKKLAGNGWVQLTCMWHDFRLVSAALCYTYNDRYYYYLPSFNPAFSRYSPGNLLIKSLIQNAYAKGDNIFDLIKGEEEYKYSWAKNSVQLYRAHIFNETFQGKLISVYSRVFNWIYLRLSRINWLKRLRNKLIKY